MMIMKRQYVMMLLTLLLPLAASADESGTCGDNSKRPRVSQITDHSFLRSECFGGS